MKTRSTWTTLILSLAALAATWVPPARALELSGWLGGRGQRLDYQGPSLPPGSDLRLHLDTGLNASGSFFGPGAIAWGANVTYGQGHGTWGDMTRDDGLLTYRGSLSILDNRTSPLTLVLGASRQESDVTETTSAGPDLTGTTLTETYEARLQANGRGVAPTLQLMGYRTESTNVGYAREDVTRTATQLDATLTHGGDLLNYQLTYRGRSEESSLDPLNYVSHTTGVSAKAAITPSSDLGLSALLFARDPANDGGANPSYEDARLSVFSTTRLGWFTGRVQYDYSHLLLESPVTATEERFGHSLSATGDVALSREWLLITALAASANTIRLATAEASAAGERIGANLRWSRTPPGSAAVLEAGGRVGLLQPRSGENTRGWGATGYGRWARSTAGGLQYGASYRGDYDENMDAVEGWNLGQVVVADMSTPLGTSRVRAALQLDTRRAQVLVPDPAGGTSARDSATRTATLNGGVRWEMWDLGLQGSLADGAAPSLASPVRGDGLFVPPEFQTHTRAAAVTLSADPGHRWTGYALARYASVSGPDSPSSRELTVLGRIGYRIGELVLSIEDRYTATGTAFDVRANEIMMSFTRHFHL